MTAAQPSPKNDDVGYEGSEMFVSPGGGAGIALQTEGELAGYLWDFFVSPREKPRTAYELLLLVLEAGGNKVAI